MQDRLIIAPGTDPNQYYASGLDLHGHFITLARGNKRIVAGGGFEYPQLKAKYPAAIRFEDLGKTWPEIIKAFCKKNNVKKPLMTSTTAAGIYKRVPNAQLSNDLFPERAVKSAKEIKHIKAATKVTEKAITAVRNVLAEARVVNGRATHANKPLTSEYLKRVAAVALAEENYACPDMIISSGKQGALPHHQGSGVIREGAIVVDIFPCSNESFYYSDMTRTFVLGQTPKTFEARYAAVLAAHARSTRAIKHGAKNVEQVAKNTFTEHEMLTDTKKGTGYIHSLGHGVGLEIHEEPRLGDSLSAGNVITVEPGLYYDYGIRVEDIGRVTKTGFDNFSKLTKNPYL